MKTFKHFIQKQENPFLYWKSSFREIKNKNIKEENTEILNHTGSPSRFGSYDKIHDNPGVEPQENFSIEHQKSIIHYGTTDPDDEEHGHASSINMNALLRHKMGNKESFIENGHSPKKVLNSIKKLSSAFKPEHTNSQSIAAYSGIPEDVSKELSKMNSGETTYLPGFTSTSTDKNVAERFQYENRSSHIIKFHIQPGAALSIVKHVPFENELLLNHGTKVTKLKTETDEHGNVTHHFIAHNDRLPLDQYPHEYKHDR